MALDSRIEHSFEVIVEWEPAAGVTAPELASTWARLQLSVGGSQLTTVEDQRSKDIRRGIYVSAYPLAEWVAEHWWLLRFHTRPATVPHRMWRWRHLSREGWLVAHNTRAAGGGMPWPDLTLVPEGEITRAIWTSGFAWPNQQVLYLTSGHAQVSSDAVADGLSRFVDQVVTRLHDRGVKGTALQQEWALVRDTAPDEAQFAAAVAALGQDPYNASDLLEKGILAAAEELEPSVLSEFLTSVRPDGIELGLIWLRDAVSSARVRRRRGLRSPQGATAPGDEGYAPWAVGYEMAERYRRDLKLSAEGPFDIERAVSSQELAGESAGIRGVVISRRGELGLVYPTDRAISPSTLRFSQARALGLSLLTSRETVLLDPGKSPLAQASRAFAAELLAPAAGIAQALDKFSEITHSAFEAVAEQFRVSPLLIELQVENRIAA